MNTTLNHILTNNGNKLMNNCSYSYRYGFNGMEKDDEVRGTKGASYDFGARMLDNRIGRWLSADPQEAKFPSFSTYAFVYNNPLSIIDPDGESGVAVIKGNKIVISANFNFYGSGISKRDAKRVARKMERAWNKAHGKVTVNGKKYKVKFQFTATKISVEEARERIPLNNDPKENYIRVEDYDRYESDYSHTEGQYGAWKKSEINSTTPAHELIHCFGVSGHPKEDNVLTDDGPHIGLPQNSELLTKNGLSKDDRVVTQLNIDNLNLPSLFKDGNTTAVVGEISKEKIFFGSESTHRGLEINGEDPGEIPDVIQKIFDDAKKKAEEKAKKENNNNN